MPDGGYRAAREHAAVADRTDRAFVRMSGRDPLKMIQGLVTNDVAGAPPGRAVYAAMLTPKGRMLADLRIHRRDGDLLLEPSAAALQNVTETLRKFVPPLFARYEVLNDLAELGVYGPAAAQRLGSALGASIEPGGDEDDTVEIGGARGDPIVVRTRYAGGEGYDVIGPRAAIGALKQLLTESGVAELAPDALEVLRIEAGEPRWGAELDENVFPLEAGIETRAISRTKGCYTGQEVIIRIMHRGHVNWRLRGLLLGEAASPARDTALVQPSDGRKVGRITSSCVSPRHGQTIALAYTRRELEPPATVKLDRIDGPDAVVIDLPFPPPA